MNSTNLESAASALPQAWRSAVMHRIGNANIKVLRMDGEAYPAESHPYDEAFLVLEGELRLRVSGVPAVVCRHELYVIPAGVMHEVASGSHGSLVIFDMSGK